MRCEVKCDEAVETREERVAADVCAVSVERSSEVRSASARGEGSKSHAAGDGHGCAMSIVGGGDAADEADAEHSEPQEEAETECGREVGGLEAGRVATPPVLEAKAAVVGAAGR